MKQFKFNEHGVCENPEIIKIYSDKKLHAEIQLAVWKGKWAWGNDFSIKSGGGNCGLPSKSRTYSDRQTAINHAFERFKEFLINRKISSKSILDAAAAVIAEKSDTASGVITKYNGGKNAHGTYQQIINLIPPHKIYIEPFVGSGAIFRHKLPSPKTVLNDLSHRIFNYWTKQKPPATSIYKMEAMDVIAINATRDSFIYLDPPYLMETRSSQKKLFEHEAGDTTYHKKLLKVLLAFDPKDVKIMISGYESKLYNDMLKGWQKHSFQAMSRNGLRTEVLWMNYPKPVMLHDDRYLGNNFRQREKIKIKREGWMRRFRSLSPEIRMSILSTLNREFKINN